MVIAFIIIISVSVVALVSTIYFLSPKLSPVPFFPTQKVDIPMIVDEINAIVKKHASSIIIDFGAGTGTVVFPLLDGLQNKHVRYIAIEIHPLLTTFMLIKRLTYQNKKNFLIWRKNMFLVTYQVFRTLIDNSNEHIIFYLYVGKQYIDPIKKALITFPKGSSIVSYMYDIPGWENKLTRTKKGKHNLYIYTL